MNKLILGDNLEILKKMDSESIDLIYLDPPFFSNRNYEVIWGDSGEVRSFQDRWSGGVDHYIAWLKERVSEMYRLLKPTGVIFLHCDWHANAHIRVSILDKIFGYSNFISEIIWKRATAHNTSSRKLNVIDNFHAAVMRFDKNVYEQNKIKEKPIGYIIAFSFGKGAIQEAARLKNMENIVIQLVRVEDIVAISKKPSLVVEVLDIGKDKKGLQEMQFKAVGNSEAGIEFYSWDFGFKVDIGFKAEILLDKKGEQVWKFKAGEHTIAAKVVDNEGLENIEIVYLKIK
jgi:SAM-dependent methyltransferase